MPTAWLKCPECSRLAELKDGRFVVHVPPPNALPGRHAWCPMSGREPGRIVVDGPKAERKER